MLTDVGRYPPQDLFSSQDMASEERRQKDQQIQDKNLFAVLGAGEQQAETDAFQCGRCKQVLILLPWFFWHPQNLLQRKTVYRQAQTRSADEPMTVSIAWCVTKSYL
jgi:transcription elongation factor S-II